MDNRYLDILLSSHDSGSGLVNYREYIDFLRGPLSLRRLEVVNSIFNRLDNLNNGELTIPAFFDSFSPENHPLVYSGTCSEAELKKYLIDSLSYKEKTPKFVSNISFVDFFSDILYGYDEDAFENSVLSMFPTLSFEYK